MGLPDRTVLRSYPGAASPTYLTAVVSGNTAVNQTLTLACTSGWYEVDSVGSGTLNPVGTTGPFTLVVDYGLASEEKILCSGLVPIGNNVQVQVYYDGSAFGRGYDGTPISEHFPGSSADYNVFPVATAVEQLQFNQTVAIAIISGTTAGGDLSGTYPNPYLSTTLSGIIYSTSAEVTILSGQIHNAGVPVLTPNPMVTWPTDGSLVGSGTSIYSNYIGSLNIGNEISFLDTTSGSSYVYTALVTGIVATGVTGGSVSFQFYISNGTPVTDPSSSWIGVLKGFQALGTAGGVLSGLYPNPQLSSTISGILYDNQDNIAALSGSVSSISGTLSTTVSNVAALSGSVSSISGTLSTTVSGLATISGIAYTNQTNISTLSGEISSISGSLVTISGLVYQNQTDIAALSGSVSSISGSLIITNSGLATISGVTYQNQTNIAALSGSLALVSGNLVITNSGLAAISGSVSTISGTLSATVSGLAAISGSVASISGSLIATNSGLAIVSGIAYQNQTDIATLSGSVSSISGSLVITNSGLAAISGSVSTISGTLSTTVSGLATVSGIAYVNQSNITTISGEISSISGALSTVSGVAYTTQSNLATLSGIAIISGYNAGGDLSGKFPSPTVAKIQGIPVLNTAPTNLQIMRYLTASGAWVPSTGNFQFPTTTKSGNYTAVPNDYVEVLATVAPITITLPPAPQNGSPVSVSSNLSSTYDVTVVASGSDTIAGGSSFVLPGTGVFNSASFIYDTNNTQWLIQSNQFGDSAGGDLTGNYPNPTVQRIQGIDVSPTPPNTGQVLASVGGVWTPVTSSGLGTPGPGGAVGYWFAGYDTTNQTLTTVTSGKPILIGYPTDQNGIVASSSGNITIGYTGTYNFQFSVQFQNSDNAAHNANVWLRKNGANLAETNGTVAIPRTGGTGNGYTITSWNYIIAASGGDKFQFMWTADDTHVSIIDVAGLGTAPNSPGFIATVQQVMYNQTGTYTVNAIAASGTNQATATPLTLSTYAPVTGATASGNTLAGTGVVLGTPTYNGQWAQVHNQSTTGWLLVYPASSATIDQEAANGPIWIPPSAFWEGVATTTLSWDTKIQPITSTTINVSYEAAGGQTAIELPSVGTPGTYGTASGVVVVTTDTQGRVSSATTTPIAISQSQVAGLVTLSGQVATNQSNITALSGSLALVSGNLVTTNSNLAALSGSVSSISGSLSTAVTNIAALSGSLALVSGNLVTTNSNLAALSGSVSLISGTLSTTVNNVSAISGSLALVSGNLVTTNSNLAALSGSVSSISGTLSNTVSNVTALSGSLALVSGNLVTTNSNLAALSGSVSSISGTLSTTVSNVSTISGVTYQSQTNIATQSGYLSTVSGVAGTALNNVATQSGYLSVVSGIAFTASGVAYAALPKSGGTLTGTVVNGTFLNPIFTAGLETAFVSATAATGALTSYISSSGSVTLYTSNASGNFTFNIASTSSQSINSLLTTGQAVTTTFLITQGTTAYYCTAFSIDGTSQTVLWQNGTAPASGYPSGVDAYTFTAIKTASSTYTVLGALTRF